LNDTTPQMKYRFLSLLVFVCAFSTTHAQQIAVDDSQTPEQLINALVAGCVEVSNISSPVNGSVNGLSSYAFFNKGTSDFPFENGIVLSTGNANSAGNALNTNALNEGDASWPTDIDLETALGISNTLNATSIEFDFTSATGNISLNYILASEEYFADYPCNYSDGFAFLIKEAGSTLPFQNIAIVPRTTTPVNTSTIHQEIVGFCPAENETFFEGYNIGDTNFNGRTTVMSASATITPNVLYNIKLIIADQTDRNFDSAVFIEANSFTNNIDLGADVSTCDAAIVLDAETNNLLASYEWFLNNNRITGETSSTLTATNSGAYKVIISVPLNGAACTFEDEINLTLNSVQTAPELADFVKCDDASNNGIENFDLTTLNAEAESNLPASSYSISYHISNQNAIDGTNGYSTINNSSSPQTIYIRAEDTSTGCIHIATVNLVVNPTPILISPSTIELCSNGSGLAILTDSDAEITNDNPNYLVSYHYSQTDASNGSNPISSPYRPSNPTEQLFVRVEDINTGCLSYTDISLESLDSPNVNNATQQINSCDVDDDGQDTFDATSVIDDVLQGLTNVTVSYHVTREDANNDINPITNPTAYQNTTPNLQIIYIRIENNNNSCYQIVALELHTNILETGTDLRNYTICDQAPDDGEATFNLEDITQSIANNLPDITIAYYETESDLNNNINAIDTSIPYLVQDNSQQLFLLIENPDCSHTTELELIVHPSVNIINDAPVTYCDTDDDTLTSVELATFNSIVDVDIPNPVVNYFETESDALRNRRRLPPFYDNIVNEFTLYVRVTNSATGCFDIKPLKVEVLPAPSANPASDFIICDNDQDGFAIIDLTSRNSEINTDSTTEFSYYQTEEDLNNATNIIANSTTYNTATGTVYAKVENSTTGCYTIVPINIIVNTLPNFSTISNYIICETGGIRTADFILIEKDEEILNGQTGKEVFYFEDSGFDTPIDKNVVYNNTSQLQRIYFRVENTSDPSCFRTSSFLLEVGSIPIYNAPLDVNVCDDNSNDGIATFSLNDTTEQIVAGSSDALTVTYYLSLEDRDAGNPILNDAFTNTVNPQEIIVEIDNGSFCKGYATFEYNIIQVPIIGNAPDLEQCDTDLDGSVAFDLTQIEVDVVSIRQDNTIVSYYANESDLLARTNQITTPRNYTNVENPQTVYIEVLSTISNCGASVPYDLIVNLPPDIKDITAYNICTDEDITFNLIETTTALIGTQENVMLTFYSNSADAQNATNAINPNYTYATDSDTIFVRAEFSTTGCFSTSDFTLRVNEYPTLNLQDIEFCDDDFDGFLVLNLSLETPTALNGQDPNFHTVTYYETEMDAINNTNVISDLNYNAEHEQILFVRIENTTTTCFLIGNFTVYIFRKPAVDIPNQSVCIDNLPLVVTAETNETSDTYLWSTGETTASIDIIAAGNYSVTVTNTLGCTTTSNFNITPSQQALVDFNVTPAFQDPHTIIVEATGFGNYVYQLNDNEPQISNVFNNVPIGVHYITVIDLNGCEPTPPKRIFIIDAPKFVTPNDDGYFDTWHITGIRQLEGSVVTIFNRYGKLLKVLKHTDYGWDGKYNGHQMPASDYWYVADIINGNEKFQVKGHFSLRL